jgi:hypothetical protein
MRPFFISFLTTDIYVPENRAVWKAVLLSQGSIPGNRTGRLEPVSSSECASQPL